MKFIEKIQEDSYFLVFASSFAALLLAYAAELIFNLTPCMLCIYQRIPYIALVFFSLICLIYPKSRSYLLYFIILSYIIEIGIAGYHIGVEHYWIEESYVCQADRGMNILATGEISSSCSEVKFKFMNLSMVEWNFIYASFILYWFIKAIRKK